MKWSRVGRHAQESLAVMTRTWGHTDTGDTGSLGHRTLEHENIGEINVPGHTDYKGTWVLGHEDNWDMGQER